MAAAFNRFLVVLLAASVVAAGGSANDAPLPITDQEHEKAPAAFTAEKCEASNCVARAVTEDASSDGVVELLQKRGGLARAAADDVAVEHVLQLLEQRGSGTALTTDKAALESILKLLQNEGTTLEERRELIQSALKSDLDLNQARGLFDRILRWKRPREPEEDWLLVSRQNNSCNFDPGAASSFTMNPGDPTQDCYMILGQMSWPSWLQPDGSLKFKAIWYYADGSNKTLIWSQTSAPIADAPAINFKTLNPAAEAAAKFVEQFGAPPQCQSFNGLRKSRRSDACIVSGSNANCFFNCFGQLNASYVEALPTGTLRGIIGPELTGAVAAVLYIARPK